MNSNKILTVSQLNRYVKNIFDENPMLNEVYIKGEISNFVNHYRSGHMYFSLKDDTATIKSVMFASNAKLLRFMPEDGLSVIVRGNVSLYEKDGTYQLYVLDMQPDGLGALNLAYEQLKAKLEKEDLFNKNNKKPIPKTPKNIGIITALGAAALQDILNILERRYPIGNVRIYPATVQGKLAAPSIVKAINYIGKEKICDVIIVARGGGSLEDLWAFNEEIVVRAISSSKIPIITGIGHETDYTLSDFAGDLRGATPSETAELVATNIVELKLEIDKIESNLIAFMQDKIYDCENELKILNKIRLQNALRKLVLIDENRLLNCEEKLKKTTKSEIDKKSLKLVHLSKMLNNLNPLAILNRGYSITTNQDGEITDEYKIGDIIITTIKDKTIKSGIYDIKKI